MSDPRYHEKKLFFLNALDDEDVDTVEDMINSNEVIFNAEHDLDFLFLCVSHACFTKNIELIKPFIPFVEKMAKTSSSNKMGLYSNILRYSYLKKGTNEDAKAIDIVKLLLPHISMSNKSEGYILLILKGFAVNCKKTVDFVYDKLDADGLEKVVSASSFKDRYQTSSHSYFLSKVNSNKSKKSLVSNINLNKEPKVRKI